MRSEEDVVTVFEIEFQISYRITRSAVITLERKCYSASVTDGERKQLLQRETFWANKSVQSFARFPVRCTLREWFSRLNPISIFGIPLKNESKKHENTEKNFK